MKNRTNKTSTLVRGIAVMILVGSCALAFGCVKSAKDDSASSQSTPSTTKSTVDFGDTKLSHVLYGSTRRLGNSGGPYFSSLVGEVGYRWDDGQDRIEVKSGDGLVNSHGDIEDAEWELSQFTFLYEELPGNRNIKALLVGYYQTLVDSSEVVEYRSKVAVYVDSDGDGVVEPGELAHTLDTPMGGRILGFSINEDEAYVWAASRTQPHYMYRLTDSDADFIPDAIQSTPYATLASGTGAFDVCTFFGEGRVAVGNGFGSHVAYSKVFEDTNADGVSDLTYDFLQPGDNGESFILIEGAAIAGESTVWLRGGPNQSYVVMDALGASLGSGSLDANGWKLATLTRSLIAGETIGSAESLTGAVSTQEVESVSDPSPAYCSHSSISVKGTNGVVIKGSNFSSTTKVDVAHSRGEMDSCVVTYVSPTELSVDTPDIATSADTRYFSSLVVYEPTQLSELDWRAVEVTFDQDIVPIVDTAEIVGTGDVAKFSIGRKTLVALSGVSINEHTEAYLVYSGTEYSCEVFPKPLGRSGFCEIPPMVGAVPKNTPVVLRIRGASQSSGGTEFNFTTEDSAPPLTLSSVTPNLKPRGAIIEILGGGFRHSTDFFYVDSQGAEVRFWSGEENQDPNEVHKYLSAAAGEYFAPNSTLTIVARDSAETSGGATISVPVGDFEEADVRWKSTDQIAGVGGTRVELRCRGFAALDPHLEAVFDIAGSSVAVPIEYDTSLDAMPQYFDSPPLPGFLPGSTVDVYIRHKDQTSGGKLVTFTVQ